MSTHGVEILAAEADLADGRLVEAEQHPGKRRFSRPGFPDDPKRLAAFKDEARFVHRPDRVRAGLRHLAGPDAVDARYFVDFEERAAMDCRLLRRVEAVTSRHRVEQFSRIGGAAAMS
nr:hypothetical protein [Rhizobium ruizarguesonis]